MQMLRCRRTEQQKRYCYAEIAYNLAIELNHPCQDGEDVCDITY